MQFQRPIDAAEPLGVEVADLQDQETVGAGRVGDKAEVARLGDRQPDRSPDRLDERLRFGIGYEGAPAVRGFAGANGSNQG